ncbi:MAG: NAD-dependent epimerase/dehydratase family protein, partial [Bacteroidota bacterium]|nr:NAD-dependent epimerase/dehydratase family protein [Bacteroidota bacterium]MDQ3536176.1 NAD-dependent epimerase/dehydratase family protein [Bacteroidota bacterium]
MKIFLTGGTGYIGENLAITLKSQGHEVYALVRSPEKSATLSSAGVLLIQGDLDNKQAIEKGMIGCDAVFHLAAFARLWPDDEMLFRKINVEGTRNILEAAKNNGVKKVVITSTAGVAGPSVIGGKPVDEESVRIAPYFNFYEATKAEAEDISREYAKNGLHVVIVNPPRVYGPGRKSESNAIGRLIELFLANKWRFIPGDGKRIGSYTYIDDIVDGHIKAWELGRNGESYLLGGENASYEYFFSLLQKHTGIHKKLYNIPVPVLVFVSHIMVLWSKIFNKAPLITPPWVKKYMYDWGISSKKAINE